MKVWLDGQCFQSASRHRGIGRYAFELVRALQQPRFGLDLHISFNASDLESAEEASVRLGAVLDHGKHHFWFGAEDGPEALTGYTKHRMLSQIAITHHAFSLQPDVALCLSSFEGDAVPLSPFLPAQHMPVPTAAIFYDIIPHRLPRLYQQHNGQRMAYKRRLEALGRFDLLLAISDYAGREAMAMGEPADTVNISAGLSPDFVSRIGRPVSRHVKSFVSADRKSLLYVGGLDQRKNLARLVAAIGKLPASVVAKLELIIVGEPQPVELAELRSNWAAAALPGESLRLFGFASDDDLVGLYKSVDLCVQPSLLEGFGLTVLEAMSCGVPVIASDRGALPEVVGVGKFLFDPENVSDIADKIAWVLSNPPEMESLLASARKRVDAFTWDNTAERTVEALKSLVTRKQLPTPSIDELRALAVEAVRKIPYAAKQASELLAAAEPMPEQAPRLLVDITSTARIDHKTGIQRVVKKISQYLMDHTPEDMEVVLMGADTGLGFFRTSINDKTGTWDAHRDDTIRISPNDTILMLDSSWEFHAQHLENLRLARLSGARIISVLYDLVPVYSPAFCGDGMPEIFSEWLKSALAYSTGFLCISKAVADELLSLLEAIKFPRSMDVGYFHLGADFAAPGGIAPPKAVPTDRPCYLMVGTMEPRKGHRVVLDAFDELWREGIDVSLTLVGRRGWGADALIDRIIQHAEFGKRLEWRSNVHDEELAEVYARSDALIAASYAEGFGLPVIEAARYGKPILASDLPVFKEVAGEKAAIRYFETGNSNALGSLIRSKPRPDPVATSGNDVGITWDESGQQVQNALQGRWYATFEPGHLDREGASGIGHLFMDGPLSKRDRNRGLVEKVGNVEFLASQQVVRLVVKVTNQTKVPWFSKGQSDAINGVVLCSMLVSWEGRIMQPVASRYPLPLLIAPGDELLMSLHVGRGSVEAGATSILVGLMQEGVGLMGAPIEVSLTESFETSRQSEGDMFLDALEKSAE